MSECCKTCKHHLTIEKWDYTDVLHNGVPKQIEEGYACMIYAHEGTCLHLVGIDPEHEMCECYRGTDGYIFVS